MVFVSEAEVDALLTMGEAVAVLEKVIRESGERKATNLPRRRVSIGDTTLHVLTASVPSMRSLGLKAFTTSSLGAQSLVVLLADDGRMVAAIEANRLGQLRTGAASGVATEHLARHDAHIVGMIGCGRQARSQLEGVCSVREIDKVLAWSRTLSRTEEFCAEMTERLGIPIEPSPSAEDAVKEADIVVTMTPAQEPIVKGGWIKTGTHLNVAGSNRATHREVDATVIRNADRIVTDDIEQAKVESGDLLLAMDENGVDWSAVHELGDVLAGKVDGRTSVDAITVFKSHGIGLWDVAVGTHVYAKALGESMGMSLAEGMARSEGRGSSTRH